MLHCDSNRVLFATRVLSCVTLLSLVLACSQVSSDWSTASKANSIDAYESFLEKHPESKYAGEAIASIERLEWQDAVQKNSVEGYRKFLLKHPASERSADASERVALLEDQAFEAARVANTTEAFEAYLGQFPGSRHESEALATIKMLQPIRGKLFGLFAPADGQMRFYLEVGDDLYDLDFSAAKEFVGDEDGSFQLGHLYDVIGPIGPRSFLTDSVGTIAVIRTIYVGKP